MTKPETEHALALDINGGDRVWNDHHGPLTVETSIRNRRGRSLYNRLTLVTEDGRRTVVNFPEGTHFERIK